MRTTPLAGKKAWFGPRRLGWGLSPVSREGWVIAVATATVSLAMARLWPQRRRERALPLAVLLGVVFFKSTTPGGPQAWREFDAQRRS